MLTTSLVGRVNSTLKIPLTVFTLVGFWAPSHFKGFRKVLYSICNFFTFMFIVGIHIIIQVGEVYQVWGNVSFMTATLFLLFTNIAFSGKLLNIIFRKGQIEHMIEEVKAELDTEKRKEGIEIIKRSDRETTVQLYGYICLSYLTIFGWMTCVENNQLPLRAWYPYDTTKSPGYQITYAHQCIAVFLACSLNICVDILPITLIRQCRCRFQLLALSLTTLCDDAIDDEETVINRIRECVRRHQAALHQAHQLQEYFSYPIFCQLSISTFIICITAYQLAFESGNMVQVISMVAYLMDMMLQVFLYCYHGNELMDEPDPFWLLAKTYSFLYLILSFIMAKSENIKEAVYKCSWYKCTVRVQRMLMVTISRSTRVARLRVGGITELSLVSFMAIIKTSYTLFTVLQHVAE